MTYDLPSQQDGSIGVRKERMRRTQRSADRYADVAVHHRE